MFNKFSNGETKYRLAIRKRNGNLTISKCVYNLEQARKRVREATSSSSSSTAYDKRQRRTQVITDDERRRVAEGLRCAAEQSQPYTQPTLACFVGADCVDIWIRLADLIEPSEPSGHECVPGECPLNVRHDGDFIDRDALLAQVEELENCAWYFGLDFDEDEPLRDRLKEASEDFAGCARRIREALGVDDD